MLTRRKFLVLAPVAVLATLAGVTAMNSRSTLQAFADTLLPADEFGPAASATGAVEALESVFAGSWRRWIELKKLTVWLNVSSRGVFAKADARSRHNVVSMLDSLPVTSPRWKTYNRARSAVMRHYFAHAERALAMGLPGPPQPEGFSNPHLPWKGPESG